MDQRRFARSLGLVDALSGWVGADDDAYNAQARRVSGKEVLTAFGVAAGKLPGVQSPFSPRTMERGDTPGVRLDYNIDPVTVSGTDQGGDTGAYRFYYRAVYS